MDITSAATGRRPKLEIRNQKLKPNQKPEIRNQERASVRASVSSFWFLACF
jgi:hypothetical protein